MTDEGVGVRVAEILMSTYQFPDGVEVVDAGTLGLGIINLLRDRDLVIIVDAVDKTGHEPGTVVLMTPDEMAPAQILHTLHDVRFTNVLEAATLTGIEPEAICIGVQIASMEQWVTELTHQVEAALPVAVAAVLDTLESHGLAATPAQGTSEVAEIIENIRTRAHGSGA